jgi:hypothetical protein
MNHTRNSILATSKIHAESESEEESRTVPVPLLWWFYIPCLLSRSLVAYTMTMMELPTLSATGLMLLCLAACGGDGGSEPASSCDPGLWHVVQTQKVCLQAEETLVDECRELDDPVTAVEEFSAPEGLPEECMPQAENGQFFVECEVDAALDSLAASVDSTLISETIGDVDLTGCRAVLHLTGSGTYSDVEFDYTVTTWMRCSIVTCTPEAQLICAAAQAVVGSALCPTETTLRGEQN